MTTKNEKKKMQRKRIRRSILTVLASIVVFVTTYALIIPAITWEKTLICECEEHVHTDDCYNSNGQLKCGKAEHKHTDACFDAPKNTGKAYFCGKSEHTHTDDCYFSDGTLKCTLKEHIHTEDCKIANKKNNVKLLGQKSSNNIEIPLCTCGNVNEEIINHNDLCARKLWFINFANFKTAEAIYERWDDFSKDEQEFVLKYLEWNYMLSSKLNNLQKLIDENKPGTLVECKTKDGISIAMQGAIPENAEIAITDLYDNEKIDLKKFIGEEASKNFNDVWAIDLSVLSDGVEIEPDGKVRVSITNERFAKGTDYKLTVIHVIDAESNKIETIIGDVSSEGVITFETGHFSQFLFASFTVDYYYGDTIYHQTGLSTMLLSDLFDELGITKSVLDVINVSFDDESLVKVEKISGGHDWNLISLEPFLSEQNLEVRFIDGEVLNIKTTDLPTNALYLDVSVAGNNPNPSRTYKFRVRYTNSLGQISEEWPVFSSTVSRITYYVGYGGNFSAEFIPEGLTDYELGVQLGSDPVIWNPSSINVYNITYSGGAVCCYFRYQTGVGRIHLTKNAVNAPGGKIYTFKVSRHTYNYRMEETTVQLTNGQTVDIDYVYVPGYENYIKIEEINPENGVNVSYSWYDADGNSGNGTNPIYINTNQNQHDIYVTCTNTYAKKTLKVKKTVSNESPGKEFSFTAYVLNPDWTPVNMSGNEYCVGNNVLSFKLKANQTVNLTGLPSNSIVQIQESVPSGYTLTGFSGGSGTLSGGSYYVQMDSDKTVTVTNVRDVQTLTVNKKIISFNPTSEGPFTFTIYVTDNNGNPVDISKLSQPAGVTVSNNSLSATISGFTSDGQVKKLTFNIPKNSKITVTESFGTKDYQTTVTGADSFSGKTATINSVGMNKTLTFTNEPPVQYTYIPVTLNDGSLLVGSNVGGYVTTSEKVWIKTGIAQGSVATANSGYEFKGWFLDSACTQSVPNVAENQIIPSKNSDGYYHGGIYYALFEPKSIYGPELPETGGIGTTSLYVISALLMLGALTIGHVLWRRREGRGEV